MPATVLARGGAAAPGAPSSPGFPVMTTFPSMTAARWLRLGAVLLGLAPAVLPGVSSARDASAELSYRAGLRYEMGLGNRADFALASVHYCRAARAGHADAAFRLGILSDHGAGMARDPAVAAGWLRRAADGGHALARQFLVRFDGVPEKRAQCRLPEDGAGPTRDPADDALRREVERLVRSHAPALGLDPDLVLAVIQVESGFRVKAVSGKGAMGLMQIIPETGRRFGLTQPFDPADNVRAGMAYLRWLLSYFDGDVALALAGYNAGENAVVRHGGIPPYPETRTYVQRVLTLYSGPRQG